MATEPISLKYIDQKHESPEQHLNSKLSSTTQPYGLPNLNNMLSMGPAVQVLLVAECLAMGYHDPLHYRSLRQCEFITVYLYTVRCSKY